MLVKHVHVKSDDSVLCGCGTRPDRGCIIGARGVTRVDGPRRSRDDVRKKAWWHVVSRMS